MIPLQDQLSTTQRYVFGFALAIALVILQWGLWWTTGMQVSFLFYISTLAVAAVVLGPGPSIPIAVAGMISGSLMFNALVQQNVGITHRTSFIYLFLCVVFLILGGKVRSESTKTRTETQRLYAQHLAAERLAVEYEQRFRVALDASGVPFVILDPVKDENQRIVDYSWSYANSAAEEALTAPDKPLVGRRVTDLLPDAWKGTDTLERYIDMSHYGGPSYSFEYHVVANGADVWFNVVATPLGESIAVWFADVTAQKMMEKALREADHSKDIFIATLAHELRNPLAPIRQAASLVNSSGVTPEQRNWAAEIIDRQSQHMAHLLDDLLDLSRITRGVLQLQKSLVPLERIIRAAVEAATPVIGGKYHHLSIREPKAPVYVEVDEVRLTQILTNLLTNAAKYTAPEGRIGVSVEVDGADLTLCVSDNGIGLKPEQLSKIFTMFTQVHPSHERLEGGLGVGLAVTRGLVELHGGTIEAQSPGPGQGSQFIVRLPLKTVHATAPDAASVIHAQPITDKRHILIADDNHDAADVLSTLMELDGHKVFIAYDGKAAFDAYVTFKPDVALLDIDMPELSGIDVARLIRASESGKRIPLVALTGWGQDKDKAASFEAGFSHHLTKPVDFDAVREILRNMGKGERTSP